LLKGNSGKNTVTNTLMPFFTSSISESSILNRWASALINMPHPKNFTKIPIKRISTTKKPTRFIIVAASSKPKL